MRTVEHYKKLAKQCRETARGVNDAQRGILLEMAKIWEGLATMRQMEIERQKRKRSNGHIAA